MSDTNLVKSARKPPRAGMGRPAGVPNKATAIAREAIAQFVDGNSHKMQEWLEQVATGVQDEETGKWLVPPNPEKAFAMLQSVVEYHVPKLARQELVGDDKAPVKIQVSWKKS
jgi:predicted transcriptional regulator